MRISSYNHNYDGETHRCQVKQGPRRRFAERQRGKQRSPNCSRPARQFRRERLCSLDHDEIAARAGRLGSLYQFFPVKEASRHVGVHNYVRAHSDLSTRSTGTEFSTAALVEGFFGVLAAHPQERAATLPWPKPAWTSARSETFRTYCASVRFDPARTSPALSAGAARERQAIVAICSS